MSPKKNITTTQAKKPTSVIEKKTEITGKQDAISKHGSRLFLVIGIIILSSSFLDFANGAWLNGILFVATGGALILLGYEKWGRSPIGEKIMYALVCISIGLSIYTLFR